MARFSVLLAAQADAGSLGLAIRSVLAQSFRDFELLVVAHGGSTVTEDLAASFKDRRLRWLSISDGATEFPAQWRTGVEEARGRLIAYIGSDDIWLPDHLELFNEVYRDRRVEWAYSRPLCVDEQHHMVPLPFDMALPEHRRHFIQIGNPLPIANVAHRRELLDRVLGRREQGPDDSGAWNIWKQMLTGLDARKVAFVREPTVLHFQSKSRPDSIWSKVPWRILVRHAATDALWPQSLRLPVSEGSEDRSFLLEGLLRDSRRWCARLRADVDVALDGLAWTGVMRRIDDGPVFDLVLKLARSGRQEEALRLAEMIYTLEPESALITAAKGVATLRSDRPVEAEVLFRRAIELDATTADFHGYLATSLAAQGSVAEAVIAASRAVSLRPSRSDLQTHLGNLLMRMGDLQGAESALVEALRLDPHSMEAAGYLEEVRRRAATMDAKSTVTASTGKVLALSTAPQVGPDVDSGADDAG